MDATAGDRYPKLLLVLFLILWAISCIDPPYPRELVLQHIPTLALVPILAKIHFRCRLSNTSYTLIFGMLLLHLVGARYLYSYVPYEAWANKAVGYPVFSNAVWHRNHYDRFVHFAFGLLLVGPAQELIVRHAASRPAWANYFAIEMVIATSALYELGEWLLGITLASDWAESYNGQQGDPWDAQKDMALATAGAVLGILTQTSWRHLRRTKGSIAGAP